MSEICFDNALDEYVSLANQNCNLSWDERWDEGNWGERYGDTRDE